MLLLFASLCRPQGFDKRVFTYKPKLGTWAVLLSSVPMNWRIRFRVRRAELAGATGLRQCRLAQRLLSRLL